MPTITIYTKPACPYCNAAKAIISSKGQTWTEIYVDADDAKREEMVQKSGGRLTVPQIFINDTHVGGFDDLRKLDEAKKLDALLV